MGFRIVIALTCAACAAAEPLHMTVYDTTHLSGRVLESVFDQVRQIFRRSEIEVTIVPSDSLAAEGFVMLHPGQLRPGQMASAACYARRDIALKIVRAPRSVKPEILGMALPLVQGGVNAMVFANHVGYAALIHSRPYDAVLACAIAHELGHVLLRSNAHEAYGIMSAVWTRKEYDAMAIRAMLFTREHSRRMLSTLRGVGCH